MRIIIVIKPLNKIINYLIVVLPLHKIQLMIKIFYFLIILKTTILIYLLTI